MQASNRIEYIDTAKGLAIILVVMGHILQFDLLGESRNTVFNFIYGFHMPVFMALSGFVVGISPNIPKRGLKKTLLRRIQQLAIPFFVWGGLIMPLLLITKDIHVYKKYVVKLLLYPDNGAWFLISLCSIHAIYIFATWTTTKIKGFYDKHREWTKLLIFVSLPFCWKILTSYAVPQYSYGIYLYLPLEHAVMFYIGYLLKHNEKYVFNPNIFVIACLIFILLIPQYKFNHTPGWYRIITSIPATIILLNFSIFIESESKGKRSTTHQYISTLGKNSIMVYLLHFLIVHFTLKTIDVSHIPTIPLFLTLFFVSIPIAYICVISGKIISRNIILARFLFGKIQ